MLVLTFDLRQGFESADYLVGGYWVWGKLIENLADIGYPFLPSKEGIP